MTDRLVQFPCKCGQVRLACNRIASRGYYNAINAPKLIKIIKTNRYGFQEFMLFFFGTNCYGIVTITDTIRLLLLLAEKVSLEAAV
jgi:hypothetical protein